MSSVCKMDQSKLLTANDPQSSRKAIWTDLKDTADENIDSKSIKGAGTGSHHDIVNVQPELDVQVIPEFVTYTWKFNSFGQMLKYKTSLLLQSQKFTSKSPTIKLTEWHLSMYYIPEVGRERLRIGIFFDRLKSKNLSKTIHANVTIYLTDIRDHAVMQIGSIERKFEKIKSSSLNDKESEPSDIGTGYSTPELNSSAHEWFNDIKLSTILSQKDVLLRDTFLRVRADIRVECSSYTKSKSSKSIKLNLGPGPPKVEENIMAMTQTEIFATTKKLEDFHPSDFDFHGGRDTQTIFQAKSYASDYSLLTASGAIRDLDGPNPMSQDPERQRTINFNPVPEIIHDVNQVKHKLTLMNIGSTSTIVEMLVKPDPNWKHYDDNNAGKLFPYSFRKSRPKSANARISYNYGDGAQIETDRSQAESNLENGRREIQKSEVPVQYKFEERSAHDSKPRTKRKSRSRSNREHVQEHFTSSDEDLLSNKASSSEIRRKRTHRPRSRKWKDKDNNNVTDSSIPQQKRKLRVQSDAVDEVNRGNTDVIIVCANSKQFRVHSDVLCSSSPVFANLIFKAIKHSKNHEIPKIFSPEDQPDAMKSMLDFLYNGTINVIYEDEEDQLHALNPMTVERCRELLGIADRYQVTKLKDAVFSNMLDQINLANAAQFALLVHKYGSNDPKITFGVRGFLRRRWTKLQEQHEFRDAVTNNPDAFLYCLQHRDENGDE